ncbi:hypothetical protein LSH36_690g04073 [Paralvinella palmiformis]|uniref:IgGFc-binding protein N-terminal domain-containing protein n=1 Tax=Paralvinella palmiformis TaxID=53620 RepID=A0AAD9J2E1_9ANNE|nr:hypothetical protein LSH36_690g04073 [Paralvinella palmiformis]
MVQAAFVYLLVMVDMSYYHREDNGRLDVYVTSYEPTDVRVYLPWSDVTTTHSVNGETLRLTYNLTTQQLQLGLQRGVRVETTSKVTIQVTMGKLMLTNEIGYLSLPLTPSSTQYFLASYTRSLTAYRQIYSVMTYKRAADVTVYKHQGGSRVLVTSFTVEPYRVRHVVVQEPKVDITGFYLESTAPVAVFSGHQCANVPVSALFCDPIFQQLLPLSDLGTDYVLTPIRGRSSNVGYTARIVKTTADTDVFLEHPDRSEVLSTTYHGSGACPESRRSGSETAILSAECSAHPEIGDFIEVRSRNASMAISVHCTRPCSVMQYNHGGNMDKSKSDPFMMLVLPLRSAGYDVIRFTTFPLMAKGKRLENENHVNIITSASRSSGLRLDGHPIETDDVVIIGSDVGDLAVSSVTINPGDHVIEQINPSVSILVQLYCHGGSGGFGGKSGSAMPVDRASWLNHSWTVRSDTTTSNNAISGRPYTTPVLSVPTSSHHTESKVTSLPGTRSRRPTRLPTTLASTRSRRPTRLPTTLTSTRSRRPTRLPTTLTSTRSRRPTRLPTTLTSTRSRRPTRLPTTLASTRSRRPTRLPTTLTILIIMIVVVIILGVLLLNVTTALFVVLVRSLSPTNKQKFGNHADLYKQTPGELDGKEYEPVW